MSEKLTISLHGTLKVPAMPNFIKFQVGDTQLSYCVRDLSDETVEQVIVAWGEAFREHVADKRKAPPRHE